MLAFTLPVPETPLQLPRSMATKPWNCHIPNDSPSNHTSGLPSAAWPSQGFQLPAECGCNGPSHGTTAQPISCSNKRCLADASATPPGRYEARGCLRASAHLGSYHAAIRPPGSRAHTQGGNAESEMVRVSAHSLHLRQDRTLTLAPVLLINTPS